MLSKRGKRAANDSQHQRRRLPRHGPRLRDGPDLRSDQVEPLKRRSTYIAPDRSLDLFLVLVLLVVVLCIATYIEAAP